MVLEKVCYLSTMAEKKIESEKPNEKPIKNDDFVWFFGFYVYFRDCIYNTSNLVS